MISGYDLEKASKLDIEDFNMLEEASVILENQNYLRLLRSQDYPHMKKQDREKFHHNIHKLAYPNDKNSVSPEEFLMGLRSKLGG